MIGGMSAALSGLQAVATKVQVNGNNVANTNTESFKKSRVVLSEQQPEGVKATVEKVDTPGSYVAELTEQGVEMFETSNVELNEEIPEMILNQHSYTANLKTIQTIEEMTESLVNIKA